MSRDIQSEFYCHNIRLLLNKFPEYVDGHHSSAKTTVTQMKKYGYIIFHTDMIISPEII